MRHRVQAKHFNRHANHRKALLRNLVRELVEHGSIVTTKPKAKVVKGLADKMVSRAQAGEMASRRLLHRFFGKRDVVNTLVDQVAPTMADRKSGFTTMSSIGLRRGDSTELVKLSWVKQPEQAGSLKKPSSAKAGKAAASKKSAATTATKTTKKAVTPAVPTAETTEVVAKASKTTPGSSKQAAKKTTTNVSVPKQRTTNK